VGQLDSGEPYLVMEQLEGIGLDEFIEARGPLPQRQAVDIVLQACEGLAEAHAVALVHRDIKPANLFLARRPDGKFVLKILDFAISKRLVESARLGLTDPGSSLGSPWYMSPEQMKESSTVDQRTDVWSLGVLLFELLTKSRPFSGESVPQVCVSVLTAKPPVPSALRPDIDAGLDRVVLRCLEKDPEKRYSGVEALAEDLRQFRLGAEETEEAAHER
jgi:serine/threonine-protein kinase